jgi:hypothetical protein
MVMMFMGDSCNSVGINTLRRLHRYVSPETNMGKTADLSGNYSARDRAAGYHPSTRRIKVPVIVKRFDKDGK